MNELTVAVWWNDPEEVVAFARWFFMGGGTRPTQVIDLFEKPWKWNTEYQDYAADKASA